MIIKNVEFENFRPFYGQVNIDLTPADDKNIILIGGRNGHGKSNFLLGVVWCLYGNSLSDVDETFKAEISHASGYSNFLDGVLNRDKKIEGNHQFGVKLTFHNVPHGGDEVESIIHVHRYYDTNSQTENLDIEPDDDGSLELSSDEEKQNFINDYLIPKEIAKFVFFDAEKISSIADLSVKRQAQLLDKTLGNMLGLNSYQNITDEIDTYAKKLKKESASKRIQEEITNYENTIRSCEQSINAKNDDLKNKNKEIQKIESKIEELELEINRRGGDNTNIQTLHKQRSELEKQREQIQPKFNEVADVAPLFMLSGLMQEAKEHIKIEASNQKDNIAQKNFSEKNDFFIESLFNKGKMPEPDINMKQKIFYAEKSKSLITCFLDDNSEYESTLPFIHNLDASKVDYLENRYNDIQSHSSTDFIQAIHRSTKTKESINQLEQKISKQEISSADEITKDNIKKKQTLKNNQTQLNREIGSIERDISKLDDEKSSVNTRLSRLYKQAKISETNRAKIELSEKYMEVFESFIKQEKERKKEYIEQKLLEELKKLWSKELVVKVKLNLLPNDNGLEVSLFDKNDDIVHSKNLSKGEQQLYISALLKAILDNSIHDLPVFIDTPLARLDGEHRDNILQKYYPNLSTQVVVFSTDTEITSEKHTDIKNHIAKSYLIVNENNKSNISSGYFKQA